LKKQYIKPVKNHVLYSKLENGDYKTENSRSDDKIAKGIRFFYNNLPSFKKYSDEDDLTYIIKNHRLLVIEILEYYASKPKQPSLRTIEGRLVDILRIFRIAYETKNYELYIKYSTAMVDLYNDNQLEEDEQELNEREEKAYVPFQVILGKQKQLQEDFDKLTDKTTSGAYKLNQDLLLVSLYSLIPINRDEIKTLKFTTTRKDDDDYIYFKKDGDVILLLNVEKKKHGEYELNITEESATLSKILKESYKLYKRENVFTAYNNKDTTISIQGLSKRLHNIFSFTGKNVGTNSIRSSYLTYLNEDKQLTVKEKDKLAEKMRTSRRYIDTAYIKLLPKANQLKDKEVVVVKEEKPSTNRYAKQLEANKRYYEKNKQEIKERVMKNYIAKDKTELARKKILYYLNNSDDYIDRVKKTTLEKYDIKVVDGRYV